MTQIMMRKKKYLAVVRRADSSAFRVVLLSSNCEKKKHYEELVKSTLRGHRTGTKRLRTFLLKFKELWDGVSNTKVTLLR